MHILNRFAFILIVSHRSNPRIHDEVNETKEPGTEQEKQGEQKNNKSEPNENERIYACIQSKANEFCDRVHIAWHI